MKYRLFIALSLPEDLKSKIQEWEKEINKNLGFKPNWIKTENIHLTILFLGWQSEENLKKIENIFELYPFNKQDLLYELNLFVEKLDYGPPGTKRMIWLYIKNNQYLENIHLEFKKHLKDFDVNFPEENREFLPHINLARLKNSGKRWKFIRKMIGLNFIFNKIVLFRSILEKTGAEYLSLKEIQLKTR